MKTFVIIAAVLAVASAATTFGRIQQQQYRPPQPSYHSSSNEIPILRQASDLNPDGSYQWSYETGNGISAAESGVGGQVANGNAQWTAPDGTPIQLTYVADENGFQPQGSHLPTPPPVPADILRALDYIRAHPYQEPASNQYRQQPSYNPRPSNPFQSRPYKG